jgi:hypothetical protein
VVKDFTYLEINVMNVEKAVLLVMTEVHVQHAKLATHFKDLIVVLQTV